MIVEFCTRYNRGKGEPSPRLTRALNALADEAPTGTPDDLMALACELIECVTEARAEATRRHEYAKRKKQRKRRRAST
mgnify:CR=1 FL=1|jgi:hypothetical protein|tara:strand:+ start:2285 stop:2518 length:234 start_codon:yes stop_codon:yes gene_type:complete